VCRRKKIRQHPRQAINCEARNVAKLSTAKRALKNYEPLRAVEVILSKIKGKSEICSLSPCWRSQQMDADVNDQLHQNNMYGQDSLTKPRIYILMQHERASLSLRIVTEATHNTMPISWF
jgi:hypothetical protein